MKRSQSEITVKDILDMHRNYVLAYYDDHMIYNDLGTELVDNTEKYADKKVMEYIVHVVEFHHTIIYMYSDLQELSIVENEVSNIDIIGTVE